MTEFLGCITCGKILMIEDDDALFEDTVQTWTDYDEDGHILIQKCPQCRKNFTEPDNIIIPNNINSPSVPPITYPFSPTTYPVGDWWPYPLQITCLIV